MIALCTDIFSEKEMLKILSVKLLTQKCKLLESLNLIHIVRRARFITLFLFVCLINISPFFPPAVLPGIQMIQQQEIFQS